MSGDDAITGDEAVQAPDVDAILEAAVAHHREGRVADAKALYSEVLRKRPGDAQALNMLGVLAAQTGRFDRALELVRSAIRERPNEPEYHFNLGHIGQLAGRPEAVDAFRDALAIDPTHLRA